MANALVVVAHPDDETIWCGGTILANQDWNWFVLSLCRRNDSDRAQRFKKACAQLNAECSISDLEDEHPEKKLGSLNGLKKRILAMLKELNAGNSFDFVFTHGANGEYGHNRHMEVHLAVKEMVAGKKLQSKKIFFFNYKLESDGTRCFPNTQTANTNTRLSRAIALQKKLLITSVYGFNNKSFEKLSCSSTESFKVEKK